MSLGIVIKGPEGVVLAADSRITLEARRGTAPPIIVNFDNATKLLAFAPPNEFVGAVTYGAAVIGRRTPHSYLPEFEVSLASAGRLPIQEFAKRLSRFFLERWCEAMPGDYAGPQMSFIVGGYDQNEPYGKVFLFEIPKNPDPDPRNAGESNFGMTWGGQLETVSQLVLGYAPTTIGVARGVLGIDEATAERFQTALRQEAGLRIPYDALPLQDCVDLAIFLIRTTISAQTLSVGIRGVGGMIEVATITRTQPLTFVQQKVLRGEGSRTIRRRLT